MRPDAEGPTIGTILDEILSWKRLEVARRKRNLPLSAVVDAAAAAPPPSDMCAALRRPGVSLIAEIKRASPSKGVIRADVDPRRLARAYEAGGAAAISVLTDNRYFRGSLSDMVTAREAVGLPVLCKDFVLDRYQVYEARAAGADAVLLIVAALDHRTLADLYDLVRALDMTALIEVHEGAELARALALEPRVIGVNNRDLRTFGVDLETTARMRARVPPEVVLVAESGIHGPADVARLRAIGADAMLVGEALVRAPSPGAAARALIASGQAGADWGAERGTARSGP